VKLFDKYFVDPSFADEVLTRKRFGTTLKFFERPREFTRMYQNFIPALLLLFYLSIDLFESRSKPSTAMYGQTTCNLVIFAWSELLLTKLLVFVPRTTTPGPQKR
jgi:hypothetical protein